MDPKQQQQTIRVSIAKRAVPIPASGFSKAHITEEQAAEATKFVKSLKKTIDNYGKCSATVNGMKFIFNAAYITNKMVAISVRSTLFGEVVSKSLFTEVTKDSLTEISSWVIKIAYHDESPMFQSALIVTAIIRSGL